MTQEISNDSVKPQTSNQTHDTGLGDRVEQALTLVGITQERVMRWMGGQCRCKERKARLNAISFWASRVLSGKIHKASEHLDSILEE